MPALGTLPVLAVILPVAVDVPVNEPPVPAVQSTEVRLMTEAPAGVPAKAAKRQQGASKRFVFILMFLGLVGWDANRRGLSSLA